MITTRHPICLLSIFASAAFAAEPASVVLDPGPAGKVVEIKLPGDVTAKFCHCPPGIFTMGSPESEEERRDTETQGEVRITKGFWMAQTECSQAQWQTVMETNPSFSKGATLPMEKVSWIAVESFIVKLNQTTTLPAGWKFALPTEAQWEYACRAGSNTAFAFGDTLSKEQANHTGAQTKPVGSYPPNAWGIHDMHGNVWEWCRDWFGKDRAAGADPEGAPQGQTRALRGGGWFNLPASCRSANRAKNPPVYGDSNLGFRLALVPSK